MVTKLVSHYHQFIRFLSQIEGIGPLLLRLYLAPIFMQAGFNKLAHFESTVEWFGNSEWGLGLPLPEVMAALAGGTELIGGVLLIPGIAVRLVSIPLMATMLVAIFMVHWDNGWLAISDSSSWLANDRVMAAADQKNRAISILRENGNYSWLTQNGSISILNNGIEFGVTYFVMLLSLLFTGGGKYTSVDYWLRQFFEKRTVDK